MKGRKAGENGKRRNCCDIIVYEEGTTRGQCWWKGQVEEQLQCVGSTLRELVVPSSCHDLRYGVLARYGLALLYCAALTDETIFLIITMQRPTSRSPA